MKLSAFVRAYRALECTSAAYEGASSTIDLVRQAKRCKEIIAENREILDEWGTPGDTEELISRLEGEKP